ncbi:DUF4174 domain-containing protein [Mycobacterium sp. NPDC006124]|uniref:DUF4174 domain-containing protein n=1 Tax=Mycobacterium sp. NPDC006124 TaxID=3156729 RepID=UPI0033A52D9B
MIGRRTVRRFALVLVALVAGLALGSGTAGAVELGDYRWERRPLLVFAPTNDDPRLLETVRRVEASRCDFAAREMVLGVLVADGDSTLDGRAVEAGQSRRLRSQFGIRDDDFALLLIGKDGGEKLRLGEVPELGAVYGVVDGMPMRRGEMTNGPGRC